MTSPLEQAGAVREPSEFATLSMDRSFTGIWTQRSPFRDADVPYLYSKFYGASRFDSMIDGINREVTAKLTQARRAGSSIYNNQTFPAINSFYSYKRIVNGSEAIRVMADGQDGNVYDATAGQQKIVFTKGAGAGKARFVGVNTALYFSDGIENTKWLQPGTWAKQTSTLTSTYAVGTTVIDSNGNLEYLASMKVGTVTNVQVTQNTAVLTFSATNFAVSNGMQFSLSGLSGASFLNGLQLIANSVSTSGPNFIVTVNYAGAPYASAPDSGTASTPDVGTIATTGVTQPVWNATVGGSTADGLSTWQNFGTPVYQWGPPSAPVNAPTISDPNFGASPMIVWRPLRGFLIPIVATTMSPAGFIQRASAIAGGLTGSKYPLFNEPIAVTGVISYTPVQDGSLSWYPCAWLGSTVSGGAVYIATGPTSWQASFTPVTISGVSGDCCVDSNGNLQQVESGTGTTGASAPTWNTTYGGTTPDNGLTWKNLGPFVALAFQGDQYGYAYQCVDGSWSTLSPLSQSDYAVIGGATVGGFYSTSNQVINVGIFRTSDGKSTPVLLVTLPNNPAGGSWNFLDYLPDSVLDPFIPGPQSLQNNPPPIGMTAPIYHLGRICAIYQNTIVMSGGPDTLTGNGNTGFAPASSFAIPEQPIRLFSGQSSAGPTLFIWGTTSIWAIIGAGDTTSPFQQASLYMSDVGILNYDAICQVGSTYYAFTNKNKFVSLDPAAGYVEVGFPIGDQFQNATTGAGAYAPTSAPTGALYSASSTFVSWAELSSKDSAIYVCDGNVGWFRFSPIASPESGFVWSPRAVIVGGTSAVQAVEVSPGVTQLLIAPKALTTGPILFRDPSVNQDWHNGAYQSYPSYATLGNIVLCQSGEVAEIAHVGLKSAAVGTKPNVGLLLGEIAATTAVPFDWLQPTTTDPPDLPAAQTIFSDRYTALQNGVCPKCDNFQLALDYGTQAVADETLMFSIYGAKYAERRQQ